MNKIILAILIGIAISSITYGALNAPAVDVKLLFLGFFPSKTNFVNGGGFACMYNHQFPNDAGCMTPSCLTQAQINTLALKKYGIDAPSGNPNICT